jgi:hypoxanthine-DNA glycosylase
MPGVASLNANQYYAHPQNAFWKIMASITCCPSTASYEIRVNSLKDAGIALWDVLDKCIRPGSLDTDIDILSAEVNNIAALVERHPEIKTICFNGGMAEKIFNKRVLATLKDLPIKYMRLPSTSPAHAGISLADKTKIWRGAIEA